MKTRIKKLTLLFTAIFLLFNMTYIIGTENLPEIDAKNAIAIELNSGNILYNKGAYAKVYPASTTKILTAILTIENADLDKIITCSSSALNKVPLYSSTMSLKIGENISVKNLLYGMLLHSGNDASNVLAEVVSGNLDDFIELMNKKLQEIGCTNTNFTNAHGFHDDNHYTTPYDMVTIMKYAMKNDTFRDIICTKYIEIPETNKNKIRKYSNTNKLMLEDQEKYGMYYEYCLGGKTGFTDEAQGTFVGYAKKDNLELLVAVFNAKMSTNKEYRFIDSKNILDYCFNNTKLLKLQKVEDGFIYKNKSNENITYTLNLTEDISTYCIGNPEYSINYEITLNEGQKINKKSIKEKTIVGTIKFDGTSENFTFSNTYPLICTKIDINYKPYIINAILIIFAIIILFSILIITNKMKNKNSKKIQRWS